MTSFLLSKSQSVAKCPFHFLINKENTENSPLTKTERLNLLNQGSLFHSWEKDAKNFEETSRQNSFSLKKLFITLRQKGLKEAWKEYRWKLAALVFIYYLVRDLFLYVFVPFVILKSF